jgi:lipopolysaccharide export system permease protein
LVLKDGHYYEDVRANKADDQRKYPFAKSNFETYTINIEIPQEDQDLEEDRDIRTDKMKNIARLRKDIDSLKENNIQVVEAFSKNIVNRMGGFPLVQPKDSALASTLKATDTTSLSDSTDVLKRKVIKRDSMQAASDNIIDLYQEWQKIQILGNAQNSVSNILNSIQGKKEDLQRRDKIYLMHILSLHNKFSLAFSCVILFFVGAPLGAIIRKGGLGLPMVIAIVLFLAYYFIGVFAGNYAKEGNIHPILGAWMSTLIMLPLGIFLTRRATADKGLMSFGYIVDVITEFFRKKHKDPES